MNHYIIQTERLTIRKWTKADLLPFSEMNRDGEVMKYFPRPLTFSESELFFKKIVKHFDDHGYGLYALETLHDKHFIGFTGFNITNFESFFTPCIEIGWRIVSKEWGKGYATEAANACLEYGFSALAFQDVYSFTSVLNKRSEHIMKKIGLKKISEFDHPKLENDHPLSRHVLYSITNNS